MLALYPLWRKARRVYSLTSRLPGTNRLGFQPSLALSEGTRTYRPAGALPRRSQYDTPVHSITVYVYCINSDLLTALIPCDCAKSVNLPENVTSLTLYI
ncbi:MAG: hypothetical protein ABW170_16015 [Candidatus Thiodiazotropha sp. L084R]